MDKTYIVLFQDGSTVDITPTELEGLGRNMDAPNTSNFQWLKRAEGSLVIALDKIIAIEPKKPTVEGVVTPPSAASIREEKEKERQAGISSKDAILDKLKATDE